MKIGFYSPSTPITKLAPLRFQRAKRFLTAKGVSLVAGSLTGKGDFYRSGSIAQRAAELNQLIHNDELDVIMATIGGTNSNSLLPYIDYEYLEEHPKTFVGYSDATAILLAIKTKAPSCRVLYGPALVASFDEWPPDVEQTWNYFVQVMNTPKGGAVTIKAPQFWTDERANWESFEHQKAKRVNTWEYNTPCLTGTLLGGNLNTIYGILASPYFPQLKTDTILLIEDAEKDAATVEKNFAMLKNAGIFERIKGVLLGKHALFDDQGTQRQPFDILREVINEPVPVIAAYDSCHTIPMITTPLGAAVRINAVEMTITFSHF